MQNILKSILFVLIGVLPVEILSATVVPDSNKEEVSTNKIESPSEDMIVLVVDKKLLQANLQTWPEDQKNVTTLRKFKIAIGKERGDKQETGDNRTPEGVYIAQSIMEDKELLPKYGPNAITLNYPNPMDRVAQKTGYGIWLHGVIKDERVEEANVTEGCVAFYNADIVSLTKWLLPHQGIVIIAEDTAEVNKADDISAVMQATQGWITAWQARDIDAYAAHYSDQFTHAGRSLVQYKEYKSNVFRSYNKMTVDMSKVRVFVHPKYAVSVMNQDFYGDKRMKSIGRKILYWVNNDGEWKIKREVYDNRRVEFVSYSKSDVESLSKNNPSLSSSNNDITEKQKL